ncbi:MAG TPA: GDP-mannose 4,6-dehydratase [Vicinamibacteria bacterium]|nr:GDP-mannose 4,6-dehydratase [Vicinamibacteria bacterium]
MRWLVTGARGFVGAHLVAHLDAGRAGEIFGLVRPGSRGSAAGFEPVTADVLDAPALARVVAELRPDRIVHLAAQSSARESWRDPEGTLRTNLFGLLHLLEAVRLAGLGPRVLVVGSAEEYGAAPGTAEPLTEDTPLRPASPYAVSKVAQGHLALQYALAHGLHVVRTRTFNHTGPGRGAGFAESSFARQIAEIETGRRPPQIAVGNLDAVRDFTDVRDVVRAYAALLEAGQPGEVYNVASGQGYRIGDVLERLLRLSSARIEVVRDPALLRPVDVPYLVGDATRLRRATGWEPEIPLDRTLGDLLGAWRERVAAEERVPS